MKRQLLAGALSLALLAACGGGGDDDNKVSTRKRTSTTHQRATTTSDATSTTLATASTTTTRRGTPAATTSPGTTVAPGVTDGVKATKVATLTRPIALAVRPGEPGAVYIAQKGGNVRRLRITETGATVDSGEVIDIANRISTGDEQGLLGITFSPDGNWLYAYYTNTDGNIRIVAYPFSNGRATASGERVILAIAHPQYGNHNGGNITFGPDGLLYVATGDGGGGGDPFGNAQNLGSLLGKMLRISPQPSGSTYSVPADNPFVHTQGAKGEVWHYGLRNPWRWSFDRANHELWIGDVGQNAYEEVDHVGAGAKGVNFGWNKREGKHAYNGGATPPGAVDPEFELSHNAGWCAIVGGYVYRGSVIRGFAGTYLVSDNCRGEVVAYAGGAPRDLGIHIDQASSFGEDATGELWVLSLTGGVYRLGRA
jgi:glucose/arabinose dehydrogenase